MTHVQFPFDPTGPGTSEDLAERLERVFGAARWVHNRALIWQWEEVRAGRVPPSLRLLIQGCIDDPAKEPETKWVQLVPRGVLLDELEDLSEGWDDLKNIRSQHSLPLKKKKDDQEIIFPTDSFKVFALNDGLGIDLDMTGVLVLPQAAATIAIAALARGSTSDAVKIERSTHNTYRATLYFV